LLSKGAICGLIALAAMALGPGSARAAGPPQVGPAWVTEVTATGATLRAEITPEGSLTHYRFEYLSEAAFQANLAATPPREGFVGALKVPAGTEPGVGAGNSPEAVNQHVGGLSPSTAYRYRVRATSAQGTTYSSEVPFTHTFTTQGSELTFSLPDDRGWEMVSPVDKNGGAIESVATTAPRVFQAAADGQSVTYSSISAFGEPEGAPSVSQYLSRRGGGGWTSEDATIPLLSGSYGDQPTTTPYQLFSSDLSQGIVLNGKRCRGEEGQCPVANPPLPGSGAPAGYMNYYRRNNAAQFTALLTQGDVGGLALAPENFEVQMVAASPDLDHILLSSCAALTPEATEASAGPESCDSSEPNLYESSADGLELINLLPGDVEGTPGAEVAAQGRVVSADGSRVYWVDRASGNLYLHRRGAGSVLVDASLGGVGTFQTAAADGSIAYFTKAGHLYRYVLATETATDLTPGGEVQGVLGASEDGAYLYYETTAGLMSWHAGATTTVAASGDPSNYPPTTGTARVSPDGTHLAFLSSASLTGYDNAGRSEVFLYGPPPGGGAPTLTCVSCNPTGERPRGPSTIPGAVANGKGQAAIDVYKPRALSADGARVFFDSEDVLVVQDTDERPDVYEWEAGGLGSCSAPSGCVNLISSGRSAEGASFVDAAANGSDAFFLTDGSLVAGDPGSVDLYDAREGGGLPPAPSPITCEGDACQPLPPAPEDPTPGTLVPNPGNPVGPAPRKKAQKPKKKHHKKHGKGGRR
jgi:hypothetical protein